MRRTLIEFLKPPLTERAPALDDAEILALGAEVSRATTRASGAASPSATSTPARATAASSRSTRSTTPITTSNDLACASSPRRATPTRCSSQGR